MIVEFNSPHAAGLRKPDLEETELEVYEEEVRYLETRSYLDFSARRTQHQNEILKEAKGR